MTWGALCTNTGKNPLDLSAWRVLGLDAGDGFGFPPAAGDFHPLPTMPVPPSLLESIQALREFIDLGGGGRAKGLSPYRLILDLFREPARILKDAESLDAVLALAPAIEAYRGKGSQILQKAFNRSLGSLLFHAGPKASVPSPPELLLPDREVPHSDGASPEWAERLSDHFFARVQGKPARTRHAAGLRSSAWLALGELSCHLRRPEHRHLALATAASIRNSAEERESAVQFLVDYWAEEDPDEATVALLERLGENPPNRDFLVTVLQAQIDLGLNDELGALMEVEDWDDEDGD